MLNPDDPGVTEATNDGRISMPGSTTTTSDGHWYYASSAAITNVWAAAWGHAPKSRALDVTSELTDEEGVICTGFNRDQLNVVECIFDGGHDCGHPWEMEMSWAFMKRHTADLGLAAWAGEENFANYRKEGEPPSEPRESENDVTIEINMHLVFEKELSDPEAEDACHELSESIAEDLGTSKDYARCSMELDSRRGRRHLLSFNYHARVTITIPASVAAGTGGTDVLASLDNAVADEPAFLAAVEEKAVGAVADIGGGAAVTVESIEVDNLPTEKPTEAGPDAANGASGVSLPFATAAAIAVSYVKGEWYIV
jgi:hypothetical protein